MDLPEIIPLFPLPNAVLFPGVPLPLHIFEPRYREMVRDTEESEAQLIGMVLLRGEWRSDYYGRPEVFAIGCAGRMVNTEALPDGRYNILLHGLREFSVADEVGETSYRQGVVRWRPLPTTGLQREARDRVRSLMRRFLGPREPKLARTLLDDPSVSDELLINFLCYALDFPPLEKQALLEAPAVLERAERLCEVVQFAIDGGSPGGGSDRYH
jgi:Lon protease-like protein